MSTGFEPFILIPCQMMKVLTLSQLINNNCIIWILDIVCFCRSARLKKLILMISGIRSIDYYMH